MVGKPKCLVRSCNNIHPVPRGCSWHQWPAQETAIHRWMIALRENKAATGFSEHSLPDLEGQRICSDHFEKTCFKEGVVRRLKPTAVPTIFKLPTHKDPTSSTTIWKQHTVESSSSHQNKNTATKTILIAALPTSVQQSTGVHQDHSDLARQADCINMGHQFGQANKETPKRIGAKCYVKGCKSGYDSCKESIHFFKPKDEKTVYVWQKFIGRNDLKLGKFHSVCHKHFDDADIIKETTVQGDKGQAAACDPTRWRLVGGAVPKYFLGNPAGELQQFRKIAIRPTDLRSPAPAATPIVVPKTIVRKEATMMPQTKQQDTIEGTLPEKPPVAPQKTYSNRKKSQALAKSPILHSDNDASRNLGESDNFTLKSTLNPKETLITLPSSPAGNSAKLSQPARNSLIIRPNVPEDSSGCEVRVSNQDKQLSLPNKTVQADMILPKQAALPSTWICQPGLLIRPNMPVHGDRAICISSQQIQQFPVPYIVAHQNLLNPKEAFLPPSWSWQENYLPKKQSICLKFKWLEENNLFEFTKSVIVSEGVCSNNIGTPTHTIRYFVRGRQVYHRTLNSQFSTINELTSYLKLYDDIPECVGYADKKLYENSLLSKFPNASGSQSNSCLLLASERSNLCSYCLSLTTPTIQHRIVIYTNSLPITDCFPTTDSQDVIACGNVTTHGKEIVRNVLLPNGNAGIPVIAEEGTISEKNPDPEAVTLPVTSEFVGSYVPKSEDLESVLIKLSSPFESSSYPLFLYHLQTWCCGIYAPSEVSVLPSATSASATPTLDEGQPIIHDWTSFSQPTFLVSQPQRVYCRRKRAAARRLKEIKGALIKWTDVENMAYNNGKVHVTLKGQPAVQNNLPRVFHDEMDSYDGDSNELNIKKNGRSPSYSSLSESEDSSIVIMDDDSEYSPSGSSSTDVEENESDENDLALAERLLRTEIHLKRRLQRKFLWYSKMLTRSKEIGRSILKASQEFEDRCRNGIIKQQIVKKSGPKKQCNECGKMIHAKGFQDHVKLHSGIKSHLCELCGRAFVFRSSLNSHIRLNHRGISRTKPPKNFMCSTCGHTVSSKERLGIHERIHTDERPFDCKYCDKKFREKGTLVRHIRTHTGERPYACNICGKSYRSRFAYVSHHRTKHETKEKEVKKDPMEDRRKHPKIGYRCEYCGKEFCQGRILAYEKHLTTHTGVSAAIPCTQPGCDFTYSDMTQLKEHTLAQHPEKAYTCDVCNKIFLTKQTLTDHRSMHDPTRGFQCSFCPVKLTVKVRF
uniref:Zinc finger protein n=1 Tax=Daphnia magna TaxID=35525 RepID=A0A0P5C0S7_9CRUS